MVVSKDMWNTIDMPKERIDFTYYKNYTTAEMEILEKGRFPVEMEDKWFWYFENNKLYMHRSWTGFCDYIIEFNIFKGTHKVIVNGNVEQLKQMSIYQHRIIVETTIDWWLKNHIEVNQNWIRK